MAEKSETGAVRTGLTKKTLFFVQLLPFFLKSMSANVLLENAPGISSLRTDCFCVIWRSVTRFLSGISLLRPAGFGSIVCFATPPVRAPINMTDQNRASASSVPFVCLLIRFV
jgi:hypothetical protein